MEWLQSRRIGSLLLTDLTRVQKWLDFTRPETFTNFRIRFRRLILQHGFSDFDLSAATTENRDFTREIGLWAYQEGYSGITYVTRHTPSLSCWAVFSGSEFVPVDVNPAAEIAPNDPDLMAVANEFGLALPGDGD